ncbi:hypothetical protein IAD21_01080 [Abditibacteriota bacterium]|nr:hypothetical protein IAD21_01080 [Abditibacteriota bacterium]
MPNWLQIILKTGLGAFLGTIVGREMGPKAASLFIVNAPYNGTCSDSLSIGFIAMFIVAFAPILGFIIGTITALVLPVPNAPNPIHNH